MIFRVEYVNDFGLESDYYRVETSNFGGDCGEGVKLESDYYRVETSCISVLLFPMPLLESDYYRVETICSTFTIPQR